MNEFLEPIRKNRNKFERDKSLVEKILSEGIRKTQEEAKKTLFLVKKAMGLNYF